MLAYNWCYLIRSKSMMCHIQIIMSQASPVLVVINLFSSLHSHKFKLIWNDIKKSATDSYPNLRFFEITVDNNIKFDKTIAPSFLQYYTKWWFPMILLVPGPLWDHSMKNLVSDNSTKIKDEKIQSEIQIMNGYHDDEDKLKFTFKYHTLKKTDVLLWLNGAYTKLAQ